MMNIDAGVNKYHDTANAVLVDVRNEDEFAEGHIPGSANWVWISTTLFLIWTHRCSSIAGAATGARRPRPYSLNWDMSTSPI